MHGNRRMDSQRPRISLATQPSSKEHTNLSTGKTTDLSPSHFDSGTVSDLDVRFDSFSNVGAEEEEEEEEVKKEEIEDKRTTISSQTWADSGVHLDSGLGIESLSSDLDIQSPLPSTPVTLPAKDTRCVLPQPLLDHRSRSSTFIYQDNDGDSPLHLAVVHGDPQLVFRILALYPEYLNVTNHLLQTALHLAVLLDFVRIVRRLVVCGAHLHVCDHRGDTPFHLACRLGHLESLKALTVPIIAKELKEAGLKDDHIPQTWCRVKQHVLNHRNYDGLKCTHLAVSSCHKVLEYILQCGADINAREGKSGKTVLHMCVERGSPELLRFLVAVCKADVNARNYAQQTPLQVAHLQKRYRTGGSGRSRVEAMIRLLRECGGEPYNLVDSDQDSEGNDSEDDQE